MPRKPDRKPVSCEFFTWRVFQRNGVWYADGRGGEFNLGKHSLNTRDREEALSNLRLLDRKKAVKLGLATPQLKQGNGQEISIQKGWQLFMDHCNRPEVMGGVSQNTYKRYRAVRDKHAVQCEKNRIANWSQVTKQETEKYGQWLAHKNYADRSIYLELMLVKSVHLWLIDEKHVPESCRFKLSMRRPEGTDTYCYSQDEVRAMVEHCEANPEWDWLKNVIITLACTGLRISELAALRHSDVDLGVEYDHLTDERSSRRRQQMGNARRTKGRRSRALPIHPQLRKVLEGLENQPDGRLLHGPRGGKLKPDTVRRILIRDVLEPLKNQFPTPEGEIGFEHGRLHSFRHYFVSQSFLSGSSEGEIMEWVGHRDSKMVAHYRHLKNEDSQRKMQKINFLGTHETPDVTENNS